MERPTETRLSQPKYNRRKLNGQLTSLTRHHLLSKHHFGLHSLWGEKSPLGIKQLARLRSLDSVHLWWAQIGKTLCFFIATWTKQVVHNRRLLLALFTFEVFIEGHQDRITNSDS